MLLHLQRDVETFLKETEHCAVKVDAWHFEMRSIELSHDFLLQSIDNSLLYRIFGILLSAVTSYESASQLYIVKIEIPCILSGVNNVSIYSARYQ